MTCQTPMPQSAHDLPDVTRPDTSPSEGLLEVVRDLVTRGKQPAEILAYLLDIYGEEPPEDRLEPDGPEHYAEAERLLAEAAEERRPGLPRWTPEGVQAITAQAQVHATLALAATRST